MIYGVEGYVVDDMTDIAVNAGDQHLDDTYIVFDIETTGFSAINDRIIEIGAVKVVRRRDYGPVQYLCESSAADPL